MGWLRAINGDRWMHDEAAKVVKELEREDLTDDERKVLLARLAWLTRGETPQ